MSWHIKAAGRSKASLKAYVDAEVSKPYGLPRAVGEMLKAQIDSMVEPDLCSAILVESSGHAEAAHAKGDMSVYRIPLVEDK